MKVQGDTIVKMHSGEYLVGLSHSRTVLVAVLVTVVAALFPLVERGARASTRVAGSANVGVSGNAFTGMSISSNLAFGPRLRAHRERLALRSELAESIKIKLSSLAQETRAEMTSRGGRRAYIVALVRSMPRRLDYRRMRPSKKFCELFQNRKNDSAQHLLCALSRYRS